MATIFDEDTAPRMYEGNDGTTSSCEICQGPHRTMDCEHHQRLEQEHVFGVGDLEDAQVDTVEELLVFGLRNLAQG
jgi:hypothetical protein